MVKQIIFIFLLLVWGCKEVPLECLIVDHFPINQELYADSIIIPPVALYPNHLFITGDKLVMFSGGKDTIFDVFGLPDCRYLYSDGIKGRGNKEFFDVDRRFFYPTQQGFKVLFSSIRELKEVVADSHKLYLSSANHRLKSTEPINNFILLDDSTFCCMEGPMSESVYYISDLYAHKKKVFGQYPDWCRDEMSGLEKMFTYIHTSIAKPDGKKFAVFYQYFKRLRIYNRNGNLENDIEVRTKPYTANPEKPIPERMVYYNTYPYATDDFIFVFCNNNTKRAQQQKNTELQIWKWDGTPVASYYLDRKLSIFTVSPVNKKLYAVDGWHENKIYTYTLSVLQH